MAIEIDLAIEFEGVFSISKAWSGLFCIRHLLSFQVGFFNWIFNLNWQSHAAIFCFTLKFLIYDFDYKKKSDWNSNWVIELIVHVHFINRFHSVLFVNLPTTFKFKSIQKLSQIKTKFLFWWFSLYHQSIED